MNMNKSKSTGNNEKTNGRFSSFVSKIIPKKSNSKDSSTQKEVQYFLSDLRAKVFFGAVFAILTILLFVAFQPYLSAIILALLAAALLHPIYRRVHHKFGLSPRMATTVVIGTLIIFTLIPVIYITQNLIQEISSLSQAINTYLNSNQVAQVGSNLGELLARFNIDVSQQNVTDFITQALQQLSSQLTSIVSGLVKNTFTFFVAVSIFFAALVFLIPRMASFKHNALDISPLGRDITNDYIEKTRLLLRGAVVGSFFISLVASTIMGITFWLLGINNALLFATLAFFLGFIPYLGTTIFTFGAAIIFALTGNYQNALILIAVQMLILNQLDLVFRPITVPKKVRIHPSLMIIAVLSGLATFGMLGIIFGPVILVLFISTVEIYQQNYGAKAREKI